MTYIPGPSYGVFHPDPRNDFLDGSRGHKSCLSDNRFMGCPVNECVTCLNHGGALLQGKI